MDRPANKPKAGSAWSWRLGRLAGVDTYVHLTFVLLVGLVALSSILEGAGLRSTVTGLLFLGALFGSVLFQELGHALAARRFGIGTLDINLRPMGGLARLERMPEDPRRKLWIHLAGPLVNAAIAAAPACHLTLEGTLWPWSSTELSGESLARRLLAANVLLVLFNLVQAFPIDASRVLRALLVRRMPYVRATGIAAA